MTTYIVVREREDKITHTQTVPQEDLARGGGGGGGGGQIS